MQGWFSTAAALLAAVLAVLAAPGARASLQPPVLPDEPEETLLAVGDGLRSALVLDAGGQPHVIYGGTQGDAPPLRHAWFDGLVWRLRSIAPDRLGISGDRPLDLVHSGGFLHVAALLRDANSGAEQLHYLRIDLASGTVTRRLLTAGPVLEFHIAIDRTGAGIGVVWRIGASVFLTEGLPSAPNPFTLALPAGSTQVLDFIEVPGDGVALAYKGPISNNRIPIRVWRSGPGGETDEPVESVLPGDLGHHRLALDDLGRLVLLSENPGFSMTLLVRAAAGEWECENDPINGNGCMFPYRSAGRGGLAVAGAAGSGQVRGWIRTRRPTDPIYALPVVRGFAFTRGSLTIDEFDALPPGATERDGFELDFVQSAGPGTRFGVLHREGRLYAARSASPWRNRPIDGTGSASGAVAVSIDPAGEPVVVADYGASRGLRATRWREDVQRLDSEGLRPPSERYAEASAAHADNGALYVAARAVPQNDLVVIERNPGTFATTRTVLQSANDTGYSPQVAALDGRVAVAWFDRSVGAVRYAEQREGDAGSFAFETVLPVVVAADASPRLALSRSGMVYLSFFDAASATLRLYRRGEGDFVPFDSVALPGVQAEHALAAAADGLPALAYGVRGTDAAIAVRYRYDRLGATVDQDTGLVLKPGEDLTALRLALHREAPTDARLIVASRFPGIITTHTAMFGERISPAPTAAFRFTSLGQVSDAEMAAGLGLAVGGRTYIAGGSGRELLEVRRIEGGPVPRNEEVIEPVTVREPTYQEYNSLRGALAQCVCLLIACPLPPAGRGAVAAPQDLSAALRARFSTTAPGRYYLELHARHGVEMARLLLADPDLLGQRIQTFQMFMPVLDAFVDGRGGQVRMTAPMLDRARAFWQRLADRGSPELRATIETELVRTDGLRDFINLTAEQWFAALPGPQPLFADSFESAAR
jgi:hypothetical protein